MAEHRVAGFGRVAPHNLPRHQLGVLARCWRGRRPGVVAGGGRIHVCACVVGQRVEDRIDFEHIRALRVLEEVL